MSINWLISYVPQPIRKSVRSFKNKVVSLFKINTPKQTLYGRGKKLSKPKSQNIRIFLYRKRKKIKDRMIRDIWALLETKEDKKERKKLDEKKKLIKN